RVRRPRLLPNPAGLGGGGGDRHAGARGALRGGLPGHVATGQRPPGLRQRADGSPRGGRGRGGDVGWGGRRAKKRKRIVPALPRGGTIWRSVLVLDLLSVSDVTLVDAEREAALRVGAHPRLEYHGRAFLSVI